MTFTCLHVQPLSTFNSSFPRLAQAKVEEAGSPVTDATVLFTVEGQTVIMNHYGVGHYCGIFTSALADPREFYFTAIRSPYTTAGGQYNTPHISGTPAAYSSTGICS